MQHDSFYTHDCTLQSLGTPRFRELAAVVLTTKAYSATFCTIQSSTAMLSVVLQNLAVATKMHIAKFCRSGASSISLQPVLLCAQAFCQLQIRFWQAAYRLAVSVLWRPVCEVMGSYRFDLLLPRHCLLHVSSAAWTPCKLQDDGRMSPSNVWQTAEQIKLEQIMALLFS
ncbi:TPA: hypothetical protein ACH3X1_001035 [Trebouxia sp. C0004]